MYSQNVSLPFHLYSSNCDGYSRLYDLLNAFSYATKDLSGVYYPTSHKVLYHCACIVAQFNTCAP